MPIKPPLIICAYACHRELIAAGWSSGWSLYFFSLPASTFLMNLVESALWDTLEPKLIGETGFGQGVKRRRPVGEGAKKLS